MTSKKNGSPYTPILIHPLEQENKLSIQKTGAYDALAKLLGSIRLKAVTKSHMTLTGYPVTAKTETRLYTVYRQVLRRLQCEQECDLFVDFGYELTAKSFGSAKDGHLIVVNSACLEELNDQQLAALLGHEIGHILADHIQNRELLDSLDLLVNGIPFASDIVKKMIWSYFSRWIIFSEYTADRAARIASGSLDAVVSLLRRQAGANFDGLSNQDLLKQSVPPVPETPGIFFVLLSQSLPAFGAVSRIQELTAWVRSEEFRRQFPVSQ